MDDRQFAAFRYQSRQGRRTGSRVYSLPHNLVARTRRSHDGRQNTRAGELRPARRVFRAEVRLRDRKTPPVDGYSETRVPIDSPRRTRLMLPRLKRLKTTIGILLSMQRENAVESITFSRPFKASM